jgi:O-antigen/teichoic acid export membrane protein
MGLGNALIYYKEEKKNFQKAANTAFILILSFNSILFLCAILLSPLISSFYNSETIELVIILLSTNLIFIGIRSVPESLIRKKIQFQKLVVPEILSVFIGSVLAIIMAFNNFGVWALVIRSLLINFAGMILIWKYTPYRPNFDFDLEVAKDLFRYGKFIVGASIIGVTLYNLDKIYISKIISLKELGYYTIAMSIANLPTSELSHIVCRVMFPVFSKNNTDLKYLDLTFQKVLKYTALITIPMSIGIFIYGPSLVLLIYGEKWSSLCTPIQILAFFALLRSFSSLFSEFFKSVGKPHLIQTYAAYRLIILSILGIPILKYFGLAGLCFLLVGTSIIIFILELKNILKILPMSIGQFIPKLILPSIYSITLIPSTYYIISNNYINVSIFSHILGIIFTVLIYFTIIHFTDRSIIGEIKNYIL